MIEAVPKLGNQRETLRCSRDVHGVGCKLIHAYQATGNEVGGQCLLLDPLRRSAGEERISVEMALRVSGLEWTKDEKNFTIRPD